LRLPKEAVSRPQLFKKLLRHYSKMKFFPLAAAAVRGGTLLTLFNNYKDNQVHGVKLSDKSSSKGQHKSKQTAKTVIEAVDGTLTGQYVPYRGGGETGSFVSVPNAGNNDKPPRISGLDGRTDITGTISFLIKLGSGVTKLKLDVTCATETDPTNEATVSYSGGAVGNGRNQDDSFFYQLDDGEMYVMDIKGHETDKNDLSKFRALTRKTDAGTDPRAVFKTGLEEGMHVLKISVREDGARIGRLKLKPEGGDAEFFEGVCSGSAKQGNLVCQSQ